MTYDVIVTEQADADLREIYEYITFELLSPDHASAQLDRLENAIVALEQFPDKHRLYEVGAWRDRGLHLMPVDNFLVFYVVDREKGVVTVIRVMYSGRDTDRELRENTRI